MASIECPRCGALSASFVQGVCRACYMRDYHQRRSDAAVTRCPRCGIASANFVHGVCRACYMRDYHQRRSPAAVRDKQRVFEASTLIGDSEGQQICVECKAPGIYARSLCRNCYVLERQRRQRKHFCVECGAPGIFARNLCQNCYLRALRRDRRIKCRVCAVCGVSFRAVRRDALYCSLSCGVKAHRARKAQPFPKAAHVGERGAVQSVIGTQHAPLAVQAPAVAEPDETLGKITSAKRGAPSTIVGQREAIAVTMPPPSTQSGKTKALI